MMKYRQTLCALIPAILLISAPAYSADDVDAADLGRILETFPELSPGAVTATPISGLYQIIAGGQISYISGDGRYVIQGDIYDAIEERNLTESYREVARQSAIDEIGKSSMIVFSPEEVKHTITVFTDIDCGYCRKLHREIADYNALGIEVRYLFFPRSGPDTASWFKAENVWCSENQNAALTHAKSGADIRSDDCGTPIAQHYETGRAIGIRGTPAIVVQGGELIPGYVPPNELLKHLEE